MVKQLATLGFVVLFPSCGSSDADGADPASDASSDSSSSSDASSDAPLPDAGDGAGGTGGEAGSLPNRYELAATASGTSDDGTESVTCTLTLYFENVVYDGAGGWQADLAGEVFRVIVADPEKYEFQAIVGGKSTLSPVASGVTLVLNDKPDPQAKPFWVELDVLHGTETGPSTYGGDWTCAPLLLDEPGFKDMKTSAPGTWTLTPVKP